MSGTYEGDLIRPLGVVTLNFGYLEYELDAFLERLSQAGLIKDAQVSRPIGQRLGLLSEAIRSLDESVHPGLDQLLTEVMPLLKRRNELVHGCILAQGRVTSARVGIEETATSVDELNGLAEQAFSWKERLFSYRWRQVEPLLKK